MNPDLRTLNIAPQLQEMAKELRVAYWRHKQAKTGPAFWHWDTLEEDEKDAWRAVAGAFNEGIQSYEEVQKHCVFDLRRNMRSMSAEQRIALLDEISEGYCRACGREREGVCHCQNDE